jgi:hypothetical protein
VRWIADAFLDTAQRGNDVAQEAVGIVVGLIQRKPRHRLATVAGPLDEERRFAEAGGGADKQEIARCPFGCPVGEVWA